MQQLDTSLKHEDYWPAARLEAQRILLDLREEFPMYGPENFSSLEALVAEIDSGHAPATAEDRNRLSSQLGTMLLLAQKIRTRLVVG